MSYLYKKPTKRSEYGKASISPVIEVNEIVIPHEKVEKVDVIGSSHIPKGEALPSLYTEISYDEHLKNLELMCKTDREFMKRVRLFCEENKEQNFPDVTDANESSSKHKEESE